MVGKMEVVILAGCVILGVPILFIGIMTHLSWKYHDYLHDKDEPTKEEWKVKR